MARLLHILNFCEYNQTIPFHFKMVWRWCFRWPIITFEEVSVVRIFLAGLIWTFSYNSWLLSNEIFWSILCTYFQNKYSLLDYCKKFTTFTFIYFTKLIQSSFFLLTSLSVSQIKNENYAQSRKNNMFRSVVHID